MASGMTPFEIGTDLSASIRIPAAYCGVFALKPTEHRVPVTGLIPGLPRHEAFASCPVSAPWRELLKILMLLYSAPRRPCRRAGPAGQK
ncbi:MAG: hypothetical protein E6H48_14100 [Betaproteobacteria bacterium]|nr:MAG: hypothetical protein E6H48_14100 [Betaproteobacteria bacterium]